MFPHCNQLDKQCSSRGSIIKRALPETFARRQVHHNLSIDVSERQPQDRICSPLQKLEIRIVAGFAALSADERRAWNALFERQSCPAPFNSLSWNEAWWAVFGRSSRLVAKHAEIFVLSRHGEIVAFFPMVRTDSVCARNSATAPRKTHRGRSQLDRNEAGLVAEGREEDAYAALVNYFKTMDWQWELTTLPAAPAGVADPGEALALAHPTRPVIEGFIIPLAADWGSFRCALKRNVKEAIRKCHNTLKRDGIEPSFVCLNDPASIRDMLPAFYQLHGERAKKRDGVHHPDYFQSAEARSLIDLLARDPAKSGMRLFVLKDGERVIAVRLAFETPRGTYLYYSGYDADYGKYSIMTRLSVEVLKHSIGRGQKYVHLSYGR